MFDGIGMRPKGVSHNPHGKRYARPRTQVLMQVTCGRVQIRFITVTDVCRKCSSLTDFHVPASASELKFNDSRWFFLDIDNCIIVYCDVEKADPDGLLQ